MNKKILLFLLMLMPLVASAQTKRTIHVATAGTLSDYISEDEKYQIEELTVTGELNGTDFRLIRDMAGVYSWMRSGGMIKYENTDGRLKTLDISNATIVGGGSYYMEAEYTGPTCTDCSDLLYTQDNCISRQLFYKTKLGSIIIPNNVTSIGEKAFGECNNLTSIVIPQSVKSIQSDAFMSCANLFSISVESGNLIYDSRNNCNAIIETESNTLIAGCRRTIIPTDVTSIGEYAFSYCSSLTSLTLPKNVTSIGNYAFEGCSGLTSLSLPNSVTSIGLRAFQYCTGLTSLTLPNSLTKIEREAFCGCSGLSSIVSEIENPFAIDDDVFYNYFYYYLKDLYTTVTLVVPPGKKSAYQNTAGWSKFKNIVEAELIGYVLKVDNVNYKIGENNTASVTKQNDDFSGDIVIQGQITYNGVVYTVTSIEDFAFYKDMGRADYSMTSVTIPNTITSIGSDAFNDLYALKAVYITDLEAWCKISFGGDNSNPLAFAQHLFLNGTEIKDLVIPNNVTAINYKAFIGCKGFSSLTIPNSVTTIGRVAFSGCSGLTSLTLPNSVTTIGERAFIGCSGLTTIVSEIENPFAISDDVFYCSDKNIYATATLIVPAGKKTVYQNTAGWNKFQNVVEASVVGKEFETNGVRYLIGENNTVSVISKTEKYAGAVSIPSQVYYNGINYTVTAIAQSAFEGCIDMTAVSIPSTVTTIGGAAFYYCTGLTTVDIPNGVKTIGEGAFSKCEGLTSVTIPGSVTSIGKNAFFQCYGLTQITSGIENPFAIDDGVFPSSVYTNASLLVPSGRKSAYQNTAGWKRFQNIAEASVVVKEFEANGVRYLIGENNTVSVISKTGKYAGAVSIPNQVTFNDNNYTVTSISSSAFEGCTGMTSISISGSVTTIGDAAFYYCTGLTTVDIPNGMKTIGEGAFSKCGGLTSVTIPGSVTSIGKNAFFQCYGLTQITSWIENPFAIDDGVFPTSVYNNASLLVPSGKKSAYQNTAGWKRFQNIYYVDGVYTLTYYVDGVEYKSVTYSSGAGITPEAEPTKEGYTFSGWIDLPETMPDHDVTVTGTFTVNQYTITYVIDGEVYATVTVDFNSKIVPLTPPSKDGFDFAWEEYPETMPAHDITINGAYTTTGILSIAVESGKAKIFTLDGRQMDTLQKGINIIRMDDGTIKKVVLSK